MIEILESPIWTPYPRRRYIDAQYFGYRYSSIISGPQPYIPLGRMRIWLLFLRKSVAQARKISCNVPFYKNMIWIRLGVARNHPSAHDVANARQSYLVKNLNLFKYNLSFFVFLGRLFDWGWWRAFVHVEVSLRIRNFGYLVSFLDPEYVDVEAVVFS